MMIRDGDPVTGSAVGSGQRSKDRTGRTKQALLVAALAALAVLLAAPLLAGCGGDEAETGEASPTAAETISITDDTGAEITLAKPAERVVSLAPSTTEDMFALGAGDRLVGVSDFCDYPEQAAEIEKVGGFADPNVEKIISLEPDLVLAVQGVQTEAVDQLKQLNVPVCVLDPVTLDGVFEALGKLGVLVGEEEAATALVEQLQAAAAEIEAKVADTESPAVFFEIYSKPLMTAGTGTLISDLIARANGTNLGDAAGEGYVEYTEEVLIKEDPAAYIAVSGSQDDPGDVAKRPGYDALAAVKDDRVYIIDDNLVTRSGPRAVLGLQQIAEDLHPEVFETSQ